MHPTLVLALVGLAAAAPRPAPQSMDWPEIDVSTLSTAGSRFKILTEVSGSGCSHRRRTTCCRGVTSGFL